jgi:hypothetical protein
MHLMRTGDVIATITQPVAKGFDYFFGTDIQNCSGCHQMQTNLNSGMNLADAFYDRFWPQLEEGSMLYIVTKQIQVEAETPEEAVAKMAEGQTVGLSVNARPQQAQQVTGPFVAPRPAQPKP